MILTNCKYTCDSVINKLKELYRQNKEPLNYSIIKNTNDMPTWKVFKRLFGGIKQACERADVPYIKKIKCPQENKASLRISEEKLSSDGYIMKLVEYENANNITIEFQDNYKYRFRTSYQNWMKSDYKNPYHPNIYNECCRGNATTKINGEKKKSYMVWYAMIQRCYDPISAQNKPTYEECIVCNQWKCFEYFEIWFNQNYYTIDNEEMCLDKDILIKNNKIYAPEFCVFVPQRINKLFTKRQLHRGDYPIGVTYNKQTNDFSANCNDGENNNVYLGRYTSAHQAFLQYKRYKEYVIKKVADEYRAKIPDKLYRALYQYEVEESD